MSLLCLQVLSSAVLEVAAAAVQRLVLQGAISVLQHLLIDVLLPLFLVFVGMQALSSAAPEVAAAAHQALARCEVLLHPRAASRVLVPQLLSESLAHNLEQVSKVARCLAGESLVHEWSYGALRASCRPQADIDT